GTTDPEPAGILAPGNGHASPEHSQEQVSSTEANATTDVPEAPGTILPGDGETSVAGRTDDPGTAADQSDRLPGGKAPAAATPVEETSRPDEALGQGSDTTGPAAVPGSGEADEANRAPDGTGSADGPPSQADRDRLHAMYQEYLKDATAGRDRGSNVVGDR